MFFDQFQLYSDSWMALFEDIMNEIIEIKGPQDEETLSVYLRLFITTNLNHFWLYDEERT